MFRKVKTTMNWQEHIHQMPHCDQRVLHSPGECQYCDKHPEWQALRLAWGIAFTNWEPEGEELPCPANHARGDMTKGWAGNVEKPSDPVVSDRPLVAAVHPLELARCAWVLVSKWDGIKKWFWLGRQKHWRSEWWNARPWA